MTSAPYQLHRIFLGNVSCFLVSREQDAWLVDCGNRGSEKRILEAMAGKGLEPGMLRVLLLTHVHFDHAGSARKLKELTGCRVAVHRNEAERLRRGITPIPGGTRWKARVLVFLGRSFRRRIMRFPGVEPDLLLGSDDQTGPEPDLLSGPDPEPGLEGFPGRLIHVPGHTPGSVAVLLDGGELLAGDTFFGLEGKQHFPPFAEDRRLLLNSWEKLRALPAETIYPAHGHSFPFNRFLAEYETALERYG